MVIEETLCFVIKGKKLLMLKKSLGLFGAGKWHGLGGKVEMGESPQQACTREVFEESSLKVKSLKYHGTLEFWFECTEEPIIGHIFSTKSFQGQFKEEGPEGFLRWIDSDEIPFDEMWEDAKYWLPVLLKGKNFNGEFHYNKDGTRLIKYKLKT